MASELPEAETIPYTLTSLTGARVLVLAPHPDDEVFGCGGALRLHALAGDQVKVIVLTDGRHGGAVAGDEDRLVALRREETLASAAELGVDDIELWGYPDRSLAQAEGVAERLASTLQRYAPTLVYCPSPIEHHPDHRAAAALLWRMAGRLPASSRIAFCEITAPLAVNTLVGIDTVRDAKRRAGAAHASQTAQRPYPDYVDAMNRFRSLSVYPAADYAEGYFLTTAGHLADAKIEEFLRWQAAPMRMKEDGRVPRVSVVIRTFNRPLLLREALASVALQDGVSTEVVVVNDGGASPAQIAEEFASRFPVRVIEHAETRGRAAAANSGLGVARGRYVCILDDDDVFLEGHLVKLASVLDRTGQHVAYTDVRMLDLTRDPPLADDMLYANEFDAERLLGFNYLPIHAVLFRRTVIDEVGGFDERFAALEDWDFWIRVARHHSFLRCPGITACYRRHEDRPYDWEAWHRAIHAKHQTPEDLDRRVYQLAEECSRLRHLLRVQDAPAAELQHPAGQGHQPSPAKPALRMRAMLLESGSLAGAAVKTLRFVRREGPAGVGRMLRWLAGAQPGGAVPYADWVAATEARFAADRERMCREAESLPLHPLISVCMPVYNPPLRFLQEAVASVRRQWYPHWELCVADDASTDPAIAAWLGEVAREDGRIRVVVRERNGHISAASNSALSLATGDFVALLDHDDVLADHALLRVAQAVNAHPDVDVVYSDEDKITPEGVRYGPYFKCAFNGPLLLAQNLISHLGVYRRERILEAGGFREGYEGSQDHDLALRVAALTTSRRIVYLPEVLYHWRAIPGSAALAVAEKNYAPEASRKAVRGLYPEGVAQVQPVPELPMFHQVRYALKAPPPRLLVVFPGSVGLAAVGRCAAQLAASWRDAACTVVMLRMSGDDAPGEIRAGRVRPLWEHELENSLREADLVLFLRGSVRVAGAARDLELLSGWALRDEVGVVGAKVMDRRVGLRPGYWIATPERRWISPLPAASRRDVGSYGLHVLQREVLVPAPDVAMLRTEHLRSDRLPFPWAGESGAGWASWCLDLRERGVKHLWLPQAVFEAEGPGWATHEPEADAELQSLLDGRAGPGIDPAYHHNPLRPGYPPAWLPGGGTSWAQASI